MQSRVFGLVDYTHAAAAEFFHDAVVGNRLADQRGGIRHQWHILGCVLCQVNEERWDQIPPQDSRASPGRHARKRKDSFRRKNKKRARKARTLYVSLDRADAIIEGGSQSRPCESITVVRADITSHSSLSAGLRRLGLELLPQSQSKEMRGGVRTTGDRRDDRYRWNSIVQRPIGLGWRSGRARIASRSHKRGRRVCRPRNTEWAAGLKLN